MLKKNIFLVLVIALFLLSSCQVSPESSLKPVSTMESSIEPTNQATEIINTQTLPTEPNAIVHLPVLLSGASASDTSPQFQLWLEPTEDELTPPVDIDCQGEKSTVYISKEGITLNNHCIIYTGKHEAIIVLPDFSVIIIDQNSIAQINFLDNGTEIILQQGAIYNILAEQTSGQEFRINTGNTILTAKGTEFGVAIENAVTTVVMEAGEVVSNICEKWENEICSIWSDNEDLLTPYYQYSLTNGEQDWEESDLSPTWRINEDESIGIPFFDTAGYLSLVCLSQSIWNAGIGYEKSGDKDDALDDLGFMVFITISNGFSEDWEKPRLLKGYSPEELMKMASEKNLELKSIYCEENPIICYSPEDQPNLVTINPVITESPISSGSSSAACAGVPADLLSQVISCDCGKVGAYGVYCSASYGEGYYPLGCAQAMNLCR